MSVIKYCGLALLSLSVVMILSEFKPKLAKLAAVAVGAALLCAAGANIYPSVALVNDFVKDTPLSEYSGTLLKALGVALAVEVTADICRDAGEASLASRLEMVGKAELLLLALPLVNKLMSIARGLLV